jgi:hypothetical protein
MCQQAPPKPDHQTRLVASPRTSEVFPETSQQQLRTWPQNSSILRKTRPMMTTSTKTLELRDPGKRRRTPRRRNPRKHAEQSLTCCERYIAFASRHCEKVRVGRLPRFGIGSDYRECREPDFAVTGEEDLSRKCRVEKIGRGTAIPREGGEVQILASLHGAGNCGPGVVRRSDA